MSKPEYRELDVFAYIGHGGRHNLYSADVGGTSGANQIATRLTNACNNGAKIIFYACNSGRLGDSILRNIHNLTTSKGFRLFGHSTAGRAGNNPNKTVFPPANGAMLIDESLGVLAGARKFRRAWNERFGNESDNLWATFFKMSNEELLETASRSVLARARRSNLRWMRRLGWDENLGPILIEVATDRDRRLRELMPSYLTPANLRSVYINSQEAQTKFATAVARWQFSRYQNKNDVDGIIGPNTWRRLQAEM
jgi:hypothetical protein